MKKGLKKQIEHELSEAINKALSTHNTVAISKTKKAVKEASKLVAKKFLKTLKHVSVKKKPASKGKVKISAGKTPSGANIKRDKTGKFVTLKHTNGVHKGSKHKIAISANGKSKAARQLHAAHHN